MGFAGNWSKGSSADGEATLSLRESGSMNWDSAEGSAGLCNTIVDIALYFVEGLRLWRANWRICWVLAEEVDGR